MWLNDDLKLWACGSGTLEYGGELFSIFEDAFREMDKQRLPRSHARAYQAFAKHFHGLRSQHFTLDVMPTMFVQAPDSQGVPGLLRLAEEKAVLLAWQTLIIDLHMIVSTIDHTGQAYLYLVGEYRDENGRLVPRNVFLTEFPGYTAIGTGAENAISWLNYRSQGLGRNIEQSAYHAFEAKEMASRAPTVNNVVEMAIVTPGGKSFHLTTRTPEVEDCPVSLAQLEKWLKKYGPQNTEALGHKPPKLLAAQKKAGQR